MHVCHDHDDVWMANAIFNFFATKCWTGMASAGIRITLGIKIREWLDDRLISDNSPAERHLLSESAGVELRPVE